MCRDRIGKGETLLSETAVQNDSNRRLVIAALLILAAVLLWALRAREQTADSLDYALSAKTGVGMYHPHHLLFVPAVRLVLAALGGVGIAADPILSGQLHNICWGLVALVSLFWIAERLLGFVSGAFLAGLFLLVSRGFWLYSTQMEVYVPATGCLALLAAILLRLPPAPLPAWNGAILALLLAGSILYHQSNLVFCLPLGYVLLTRQGGRRPWDLGIVAGAGVVVLAAYLLAFKYADVEARIPDLLSKTSRTPGDFLRFCLAYKFHPSPGWGTWRNFSVMGAGRLVHSQIRTLFTFPESLRAVVIPGFGLLVAGLIVWHAGRAARGGARTRERRFLLIWLVSYYLFFLWWFPGEKEFFITTLVPLVLLAALGIRDLLDRPAESGRRRVVACGFVTALLISLTAINATQTILPYHRDRGPAFAAASVLAGRVPPECLVLGDYTVGANLRYYFGRRRTLEAAMPLFFFYRGSIPPARYQIDAASCLAVDLAFLRPDYSLGGFDGYNHPEEWSKFTEWVLGFDVDAARNEYSCRQFEGIGGAAYILLPGARSRVEGIRPIFRRLDDETAADLQGARPFEAWLDSETPHSLRK